MKNDYTFKEMLANMLNCIISGLNVSVDLVLSNKPDTVTNLRTIPGLSTANDHEIIVTDILCTIPVNKNLPRKVFQWKKGDIAGLKLAPSNFAKDYLRDFNYRTVNENFYAIQSFLLESQSKFIPTKVISGKYSYPWITPFLKKKIARRQWLYRSILTKGNKPHESPNYIYYSKLVDRP